MKQSVITACAASFLFFVSLITILYWPPSNMSARMECFFKCLAILFWGVLFMCLMVWEKHRHLYNERLKYNQALFSAVTENLDEGVAILTGTDCFETWNSRFLELIGTESGLKPNCRASDVLPDEMYRFAAQYRSSLTTGLSTPASQVFPLGETYLNVRLFSVSDQKGSAVYALLLQDCTKYIRMEENLTGRLDEVRHHMDTKSSLLANVSHELKTPLNAIFGLNHILEGTDLDDYQRDLVSKIGVSSDCLKDRINDILDLSELKKGSLSPHASSFRLQDMMDALYKKYYILASHKHIQLIEDYQFDSELYVCLDRSRVEQILSNLIGNACKFTEAGYVRTCVYALQETEDTISLQFMIEDTGIGIEDKEIPNIFNDFYQSEDYLTKEYQGTGLGLPICKYLAETMDGSLSARSKKGFGSNFVFTVTAPKSFKEQHESVSSLSDFHGHGENVLVVEDAPLNYEVVSTLLENVNVHCDHAESGLAALNICEKVGAQYYKAIFMDIHMPVMDGYETSRKLKAMGIQTPIIALTATSVDAQMQQDCKDLFADFVFKPFKYTQLYQALSPYIERLPVSGKTPAQSSIASPSSQETGKPAAAFPETSYAAAAEASYIEKSKLPYIDREEAIENMGGNLQLYEKHLAKFKTTYAGSYDLLQKSLQEGDLSEVKRLAHSVKGLAATLGLAQLARSAEILEFAASDGAEDLSDEMKAFKDSLAKTLET